MIVCKPKANDFEWNEVAVSCIQSTQKSFLGEEHEMGYKKSAKDLAFDRERTRLQAEIGHLRDSVVQKEKTIRALADELRCERGKNEEKEDKGDK